MSLEEAELAALASVLEETGIYVVADEIYSELHYESAHVSIRKFLPQQTIVINGLSKSHAMIGFRIGFLMAEKSLLQEMLKVHQYTVTCASSISQKAALEAVTNGKEDCLPMRTEYKTRAGFVEQRLLKMGFEIIPPDGAFLFFSSSYQISFKKTPSTGPYVLLKKLKLRSFPGKPFPRKASATSDYLMQHPLMSLQKPWNA